MKSKSVRIGSGAGYAGDRIDPAIELAEKGNIQYICFECLAERTIALAQLEKRDKPHRGYGQFLEARMEAMLPFCAERGLVMISNLGAANPSAALMKTLEIAERLDIRPLKIAAISGDDVLESLAAVNRPVWETGQPVKELVDSIISANAYLGVETILPALSEQCNVIITGRVADPSLYLAPMIYELGWSVDSWTHLGAGTAIAHLLECAAQVTGGYFVDPGKKDVPDLAHIGFPLAEIYQGGEGVITKVPGTGGAVSVPTCKEQLLYEVHDPSRYLTPDVMADFSQVTLTEIGVDRVMIRGASGSIRPDDLKVSLGIREGYIGEGEISYAGHGALKRARLSAEIVQERLKKRRISFRDMKTEIIGYNALLGSIADRVAVNPFEVRLRVAAKCDTMHDAEKVGEEVENLYLNGPAGPGGARKYVRPVIGIVSTSIPRDMVKTSMDIVELP
ncbi:MAG: DUF1446 domain-containing protein [Deltaproteobacteria bacterium]|nr:DUF1446 domain-containing protein [Deltaproteobacteria bacterium]